MKEVNDNWKQKIDPDANPLLSNAAADDFIDTLFEDIDNGVGELWQKKKEITETINNTNSTSTMAKKKQEEENVQGTETQPQQKEKKPAYAPLDDLVGHKNGEIYGVKIKDIDPKDIARLEKGLMTDKVYDLTLSNGNTKEGKLHLAKNAASPEVKAYFTLKTEKPFIPQTTMDGKHFTQEQQDILRSGKNILYNVTSKNGQERLKVAKLDLQKGNDDKNYTNQLVVKDVTNLPVEKFSFVDQKMNNDQIRDFLNGTGAKVENPVLKGKQFKGTLTQYFDPIKGTSNFRADAKLKESFALNKVQKEKAAQTTKNKPQIS